MIPGKILLLCLPPHYKYSPINYLMKLHVTGSKHNFCFRKFSTPHRDVVSTCKNQIQFTDLMVINSTTNKTFETIFRLRHNDCWSIAMS